MTLDESFETIRSGLTGIIISLPKEKNLSYLIKFSNQEGSFTFDSTEIDCLFLLDANNFKKHLLSIKLGRSIDENASCQFDERTEESSAVQYFQVCFIIEYSSLFECSFSSMDICHNNRI